MTGKFVSEKVNPERLKQVLLCDNVRFKGGDASNSPRNKFQFFDKLNKYSKLLDANGEVKLKYYQNEGFGRYFVENGLGLQNFNREVALYLMEGRYLDLDFVNCHPMILKTLLKKHRLTSKFLEEYTTNRSKVLEMYDLKKTDIITCLYSKNCNPDSVMSDLHQIIYTNLLPFLKKTYAEQWKKTSKKFENREGSFLSRCIQDIENTILMTLESECIKQGYNPSTLMFDGLHLECDEADVDVKHLENVILEKTGYPMKLSFKSTETDWAPNIRTEPLEPFYETEFEKGTLINDGFACERLSQLCPDKLVYCETTRAIYNFQDETGLWLKNDANCNKGLCSLLMKHKDLMQFYVGDRLYDYAENVKCLSGLMKFLPNYIKSYSNFIDDNIERSLRKILHSNGIYDMKTGIFTEGFDPKLVFADRINRAFNPHPNLDQMAVVENLLFSDGYIKGKKDHGLLSKTFSAMTLAGDYQHKKYMIVNGPPNSSKGLLTTALLSSCGGYFGTFDLNCLLMKPNSGSDEAKQLAWIHDKVNKRGIIANEGRENSKSELCGNTIKKIIGGGDRIESRKNFENQSESTVRCGMIWFVNSVPKISPYDQAVDTRTIVLEMDRTFVEQPEDPETEGLIDLTLKASFMNNDEWKDAVLGLLYKEYLDFVKGNEKLEIPESCKLAKKDAINNSNEYTDKFEELYENTGNEDDYILVSDFNQVFFEEFKKKPKRQVSNALNQIIKSKFKFIDGRSFRVKLGIKERTNYDPSNDL
jgi:hypothetical protein